MGGCRCTYRTCRATTDGNTHFFHYPVFDKVRCHQWLSNAHRFDLLDLKLSQLKNRVVCQHHFPDDMFMNIKKQKLTHTAVPTLGGPFLEDRSDTPAQELAKKKTQETPKIDVKNDIKFFTTREKMATFSVPYNEFLKKCDLDQLNDPDLRKSIQAPKKKLQLRNRIYFPNGSGDGAKVGKIKDESTASEHPHVLPASKTNKEAITIEPFSKLTSDPALPDKNQSNKVVILSEKKVTEPLLPLSCRGLKKVSPSFILKKPHKIISEITPYIPKNPHRSESILSLQMPVETMRSHESSQVALQEDSNLLPQIVSVNSVPLAANNCPTVLQVEFAPEEAKIPVIEQPPVEIPPPPTLKKRPVLSTDIEAEKKRKYNIRLKDVVEKALSRLDETQRRSELTPNIQCQASSGFKSKHTCSSPKKQSLTAALLRKVRQNSRDIAEIRRLLQQQARGTPANGRSSRSIVDRNKEMDLNPESRKKYLFKEISQFLSTKLRSDLYEEMFIDNLVHKKTSIRSTRGRNKQYAIN